MAFHCGPGCGNVSPSNGRVGCARVAFTLACSSSIAGFLSHHPEPIAKRKNRRSNWTRLERCRGPHFQPDAYSVIVGSVNCDSTVNPLSRQNSSSPAEACRVDLFAHSGLAPRNNARIFRVVLFALPPLRGEM